MVLEARSRSGGRRAARAAGRTSVFAVLACLVPFAAACSASGGRRAARAAGRASVFAVLACLVPFAAACSASGGTSGGTSPGTGTPATAGRSSPCAWATIANKATLNVAYPDTSATYWATSYVLAPGERLVIHGRFPAARYMSFTSYGPTGGALHVLTDRRIDPDPGGVNPFRGGGAPGGRYTVQVRGDSATAPNTLSAKGMSTSAGPGGGASTGASAGSASPSSSTITPGAAAKLLAGVHMPATLGTGTPGAAGAVSGTVIYRIYLPERSSDPTGGGGLPDISLVHANGTVSRVPTCAHPGPNPGAVALINAAGPATNRPVPVAPVFIRPAQGNNLFPDPDNTYIATLAGYEPGRIVVVRAEAPTFPDTSHGAAVSGREQVRYWSLCTDEYRKPYPVSFCVPDQDVVLGAGRMYTIVVSTPADRPANATAANGVTWLDWGDTSVTNLLLMRQMLASPGYAQAAALVPPGKLALSTMGPYAPVGVYCSVSTFSAGGPSACFTR